MVKDKNSEFKTGEECFLEQACYLLLKKTDEKVFHFTKINGEKYILKLTKVTENE